MTARVRAAAAEMAVGYLGAVPRTPVSLGLALKGKSAWVQGAGRWEPLPGRGPGKRASLADHTVGDRRGGPLGGILVRQGQNGAKNYGIRGQCRKIS